MPDKDALSFALTWENVAAGDDAVPSKVFTVKLGQDKPIRIGRAPANDVVVDRRGVSQYHCELRLLRVGGASPQLCIKDKSMNGTGLKRPDGAGTANLDKEKDTPVPDGSTLYVPMMLKNTQPQTDRAHLRVVYKGSGKVDGNHEPPKAKKHKANGKQEAASPAAGGDGEDDSEPKRMRFVELLLKTKEVSAGTSYEQAQVLLGSSADWHAVDAVTRRECFGIFVQHLSSHGSKKKDKKNGKEKNKEKPKKSHRDEVSDRPGHEDKRRRKCSRSRDAERKHKKHKRRGSDGSGSRRGSPPGNRERGRRHGKRSRSN